MTFWSTFFTATPVLCYGIFEKDLPENVLLNFPGLYRSLSRNGRLRTRLFIVFVLIAVCSQLIFSPIRIIQLAVGRVRDVFCQHGTLSRSKFQFCKDKWFSFVNWLPFYSLRWTCSTWARSCTPSRSFLSHLRYRLTLCTGCGWSKWKSMNIVSLHCFQSLCRLWLDRGVLCLAVLLLRDPQCHRRSKHNWRHVLDYLRSSADVWVLDHAACCCNGSVSTSLHHHMRPWSIQATQLEESPARHEHSRNPLVCKRLLMMISFDSCSLSDSSPLVHWHTALSAIK